MANYSNLKAAIAAAIKQNGNQEITGQVLQDVLTSMVSVIGANYTFASVATPATNPGTPDQNVFYLAMEGGTYTNFNGTVLPAGISLLMWNGTWTSKTVMCGDGGVFDISVYKSSGGTLATFADLAAALDGGNNIPASARNGGMSVKFVQSSDNKYVQYRLMSDTFNTTVTQWQGVDDEPTAGSKNLVESGGVAEYDNKLKLDISGTARTIIFPIALKKDEMLRWEIDSASPWFYMNLVDANDNYTEIGRTSTNSGKGEYIADKDYVKLSFYGSTTAGTYSISGMLFVESAYSVENINILKSVKADSLFYSDIYTSKSDNFLDITNVLKGYEFDENYNIVAVSNKNHILSRPIYVGDITGGKITISGYTSGAYLKAVFYKSNKFINIEKTEVYNLTNTARTLNVGANDVFVVLSLSIYDSTPFDFSNMKVSKTDSQATRDFSPLYLGNSACYQLFNELLPTRNDIEQQNKKMKRLNVNSLVIPYSVSNSGIGYDASRQFYKGDYALRWKKRYRALADVQGVDPMTEPTKWVADDKRLNLLFFTDSHIIHNGVVQQYSLDNVKETIEYANELPIQLDAIIHTGDIVTTSGEYTKTVAKGWHKVFFDELKKSQYPVLFSIGNHDNNDWANVPSNAFTNEDWSDIWFDYAESAFGIVRQTRANGFKSNYFYYDIPDKRVRVISVDVQDVDNANSLQVDASGHSKFYGGNSWHISQEQMSWIANTALNIQENGWGVIIMLHQTFNDYPYSGTAPTHTIGSWYAYNDSGEDAAYTASAIRKLFDMCVCFNNQLTYTQEATSEVDEFYNMSAMSIDFGTRFSNLVEKPSIICWLNGHEHIDRINTIYGSYTGQEGIKGINVIATLNGSAANASSVKVLRVDGTMTQNGFDIISIDTVDKKIRMVRYGAGLDCYGQNGDRFLPEGLSY